MDILCENCGHDHGLKEQGIAQAQMDAADAPVCHCGCSTYKPVPVVEDSETAD